MPFPINQPAGPYNHYLTFPLRDDNEYDDELVDWGPRHRSPLVKLKEDYGDDRPIGFLNDEGAQYQHFYGGIINKIIKEEVKWIK